MNIIAGIKQVKKTQCTMLCSSKNRCAILQCIIVTNIQYINRHFAQIPQCTRPISHNASFCNKISHYKMVHCGIFASCIVGFGKWVYWSMQKWLHSIVATHVHSSHVFGVFLHESIKVHLRMIILLRNTSFLHPEATLNALSPWFHSMYLKQSQTFIPSSGKKNLYFWYL